MFRRDLRPSSYEPRPRFVLAGYFCARKLLVRSQVEGGKLMVIFRYYLAALPAAQETDIFFAETRGGPITNNVIHT